MSLRNVVQPKFLLYGSLVRRPGEPARAPPPTFLFLLYSLVKELGGRSADGRFSLNLTAPKTEAATLWLSPIFTRRNRERNPPPFAAAPPSLVGYIGRRSDPVNSIRTHTQFFSQNRRFQPFSDRRDCAFRGPRREIFSSFFAMAGERRPGPPACPAGSLHFASAAVLKSLGRPDSSRAPPIRDGDRAPAAPGSGTRAFGRCRPGPTSALSCHDKGASLGETAKAPARRRWRATSRALERSRPTRPLGESALVSPGRDVPYAVSGAPHLAPGEESAGTPRGLAGGQVRRLAKARRTGGERSQ